MPEAIERIRELRALLPAGVHVQVDGGIGERQRQERLRRGRRPDRLRSARSSAWRTCRARTGGSSSCSRERTSNARSSSPSGAGDDAAEPGRRRGRRRGRRGRRRGLARAAGRPARRGRRARGGRRARARRDALRDDGAVRAITARRRRAPRPCCGPGSRGSSPARSTRTPRRAAGSSCCARRASRSSTPTRSRRARQNEAWRTWVATGRPFVTLKLAVTLDGRVTVPGSRWVSGEESRRLVHELRAAVGRGRGRHGHRPRRRAAADRARRRRAEAAAAARVRRAGRSPTAPSSSSSTGPLEDELARLGGEGVQSLLLEGGPTLATAFLDARPRRQAAALRRADARRRRAAAARRSSPRPVAPAPVCEAEPVGEDVLLTAYVHEP